MPDLITEVGISRYRQLVKAINKLTRLVTSQQIYEFLAHTATTLTESDMAWGYVFDQTRQVFHCEIGLSCSGTDLQGMVIPFETSLEGHVFRSQRPIKINEINTYNNSFGSIQKIPGINLKNILLVPAVSNGKLLFVLEVANKRKGEFSDLDQEILSAFAQQAATCLENSQHIIHSDLIPELVHELRTPLAALNTALHLLQRTDLRQEKREQISQIIQIEFTRLTDLTTSFLDYARLKSGKEKFVYNEFDLNSLVRETVEITKMQFDGRDTTISYHLPTEPVNIVADRNKIKQVILNLITNAVIYNRPSGIVTITTSSLPGNVILTVEDTGIGIPEELIPQLFERFYRIPNTEKQIKGTGLGLTICKQIIEAHNGQINVTSEVGVGSIFTIQLPFRSGK